MSDQHYSYIRFNWGRRLNLDYVAEKLKDSFEVEKINMPDSQQDISMGKNYRDELSVKSDTLVVRLSKGRAYISQKLKAPFTRRDLELRKKVFEFYPRNRPTPLPFGFNSEPEFEVEER